MFRPVATILLPAFAGLAAWSGTANADPQSPAGSQVPAPPVPGWNDMLDSLRDLPSRVLAKLPEDQRGDPLVRQEAAQLALGALTSAGISALGADVDHPMFLPLSGPIFGIGQPNADTIYKTAHVSPGGVYRLRGTPGSVRIAAIAQHGATPGDPHATPGTVPRPAMSHLDLNALPLDAQGRFDVIVSPERPAAYAGQWWKLEPGTAKLMARFVSSDWEREREPTLAIERLDKPVRRVRPRAGELRQRLERVAAAANFIAPMMAADPARLKRAGYVNRLKVHDEDRGMLSGQFYYHGDYDLKDGEALLLETRVPAQCSYWSIILTNHLYVTTDWSNNQSSLNDSQAGVDGDGILRIVISGEDPGVPNWVDTAGYPFGMIQWRWFGCEEKPMPAMRKLALSELREALPADTPTISPGEREDMVRERRAALQQRSYW